MTCRQALAVTGNYTHAIPYNSESTIVLRYNYKLFLPLTDPRKEPRFCDRSFFVCLCGRALFHYKQRMDTENLQSY